MSHSRHVIRSAIIVIWAIWLAYTCFKRAVQPPRDNSAWWHLESYAVNKNPLVRLLNVVVGVLILYIGLSIGLEK